MELNKNIVQFNIESYCIMSHHVLRYIVLYNEIIYQKYKLSNISNIKCIKYQLYKISNS